jgi:hypothetical protein
MVCDVALAFLILLIPAFYDFGHFIDVPNELIHKPPLGSDCVHIETRMGSESDHEQARSIANQRDSREIYTLKVLND